MESLSISSVCTRARTAKETVKVVSIIRRIRALYRDRSPAKSLLVTRHGSRSCDSLECTIQHLAIRSHDLDQSRIFPRKTVPSAPLFTIRGMHAQTVDARRQSQ